MNFWQKIDKPIISLSPMGGVIDASFRFITVKHGRPYYLTAVGLPLKPIADYLKSRGITVPLNVEKLYADKSFLNWQSF